MRERRQEAVSADSVIHALWASIPSDSGLVFWPSDTIYRLLGYQWLGGERRGLEPCNPGSLTYGPARRVFMRRHGFDPYGGVRRLRDRRDPRALVEFYVDLYDHVNRRTRLPVMVFDPRDGRVHMLAKPRRALPP
jgi:hypothetical protein